MYDPKTVVETIHDHYARKASPEVWAEVDALRERVAELETALKALCKEGSVMNLTARRRRIFNRAADTLAKARGEMEERG